MELASSQACNNHQRNKEKLHSIKRMLLMKLRFNFPATMLVWSWLSSAAVVVQEELAALVLSTKRALRKQRKENLHIRLLSKHHTSIFH